MGISICITVNGVPVKLDIDLEDNVEKPDPMVLDEVDGEHYPLSEMNYRKEFNEAPGLWTRKGTQ